MWKEHPANIRRALPISRRRFVQGLAAGSAVFVLGSDEWPTFADTRVQTPAVLSGTHFDLHIESIPVNFTGRRSLATAVNGSVPGPTLRWREGDTVTLAVTNRLKVPASIHWHAIRLPSEMDGVPGLSFPGIAPNETFIYKFRVVQNGTYWYHSHSRFQEQTGLLGAIIIDPQEKVSVDFDREYVVVLTDWTDTNPETIFSNLKQQSEYYNFHQRTAGTFFSDVKKKGLGRTISDRLMWGRMNMTPTDISDVSSAAYTYLMNGNPPNANWLALFEPGERVRLRFINGSAETFFDVRIPGLPITVVAADGNEIEPVTVDEFRIGVAEVYDVIVQPHENAAFTIFAQSEDRTGYARGTLAPKEGMAAVVPPMDPRPMRTMTDMGMSKMAGMNMAGIRMEDMQDMQGMPGMNTGDERKSVESPKNREATEMENMSGMDMGAQKGEESHNAEAWTTSEAHGMAGMKMGTEAGTTPFPQPGPDTLALPTASGGASDSGKLQHSYPVHIRLGPEVDMVPMRVSERLNDPGDGLNNSERRVLTYADIRARYRGVDPRPPTREIELYLTGNMERFIWGFDGHKFSSAEPIELKLGERLRIILINSTMMEHPIHLHGLWSELENGHQEFNPYKHTVIVKPSERISFLLSADTPGKWAFHCHLLYHMEAGMFRTVVVS